jgi:hypothetical protein
LRAGLPLAAKTGPEAEGLIRSFLSQQSGGTKFGDDLQGYLFYIYQMSNNGHWNADETHRAISLFMDKDISSNQERAQRNPLCTRQLESGYALKDEIDKEYFRARKSGTFQDQQNALIDKWVGKTSTWEADTGAVLVQIDGPAAKGRFRNGQVSPTALSNTNIKWNQVRNVLQARLTSLDEICRDLH